MSKAALARQLRLNRQTGYQYLALPAPPQRHPAGPPVSAVAPYAGDLLRRWAAGGHNARQLWRELHQQGSPGAYRNVARITGSLRHQARAGAQAPPAPAGLTPRQAVALLRLRPGDRTTAERQTVEQVKGRHQEVRQAVRLLAGFARLLRARPHEQPDQPLGRWIGEGAGAGLPEFAAVVTTIRQDLAAVLAALRLPWSQGQTEGQITKLTLLTRSLDGRSGCDLLTPRVLYASAAF